MNNFTRPKLNEITLQRHAVKISANRLRRCRYYTRVRVQSPEKGSYTRAGEQGEWLHPVGGVDSYYSCLPKGFRPSSLQGGKIIKSVYLA